MVRSTVSFALALMTSVLPATAQSVVRPIEPNGALAGAIARESHRLALDPQVDPTERQWSRVRKLEPGREIIVTAGGTPLAERTFVAADDLSLTVLNLET